MNLLEPLIYAFYIFKGRKSGAFTKSLNKITTAAISAFLCNLFYRVII